MEKEENGKQEREVDLLDVLLDEDNTEPIVLYSDDGRKLAFDQVAVIPYENEVYAILKPLEKLENIEDDEAIVFRVDETDEGEHVLKVEMDVDTAESVFAAYYKLFEEAHHADEE